MISLIISFVVLHALLIFFLISILSWGPLQFIKGRKKVGFLAALFITVPLVIVLVNDLIVRPKQFKEICSSGNNWITLNPVETNQIALDIKYYEHHSGITIDAAVKKVISGDFEKIEVVNTQSNEFQRIVDKYGMAQGLKNNQQAKVLVFSSANRDSADCWWHDFMSSSTQSLKNPARATKHFKFDWDKAGRGSNECLSLQYRDAIESRYIVEIKETLLDEYNFSKYSVLVKDKLFENSTISERVAYRIHPSNFLTAYIMKFNSANNGCPTSLYGSSLGLLFNKN